MNTHASQVDHEQASLLLPWLVNGTLSETERRGVEQHAAECADCAAEVESLKIMQAAIRNDALAPIVPKADASKVLSRVESMPSADGGRQVSPAIGYAIAASVLIVIAITSLLRVDQETPEPVIFETATSASDASVMHYVFELRFDPNTTDAARQHVFTDLNSVDISRANGDRYKVTVPLTVSSVEELQDYAVKIRSMPDVMTAEIIALQLPIRNEQ